jgi:hypothetical protein
MGQSRPATDQRQVSRNVEPQHGGLLFLENSLTLPPRKSSSKLKCLLATKLLFPKLLRSAPVLLDRRNDSARTNTAPKDGVDLQPTSLLPYREVFQEASDWPCRQGSPRYEAAPVFLALGSLFFVEARRED